MDDLTGLPQVNIQPLNASTTVPLAAESDRVSYADAQIQEIDLAKVVPNPYQPRKVFQQEALQELADSIREQGIVQPLIVRERAGHLELIAGERRWRASRLAGLTEVPCVVVDTDEKGVAEIALIENLQRKDLNIWEEADGLKALADRFGYTQEEIAHKISKSRSTVTELMSVAGLPQSIREKCREQNISSKATLLEIARQFDEAAMFDYLKRYPEIKKEKDAVRKAERPNGKNGGAARIDSPRASQRAFVYKPDGAVFRVEVRFDDPSAYDKTAVLTALKQAFDSVKSDQTAI